MPYFLSLAAPSAAAEGSGVFEGEGPVILSALRCRLPYSVASLPSFCGRGNTACAHPQRCPGLIGGCGI
jgi:hypothetical protein